MRFKLTGALALLFAQAGWCNAILSAQADACLDGSANCSQAASGTLNNGSDTMSWTGNTAVAGFGILHVATDLTNYSVTNGTVLSYGYVGFTDYLTISDPAKTGQTGSLSLSYYIDGTVGHTGSSSAFLQVVTRVCSVTCPPSVPAADNYVTDFDPSALVPLTTYNETIAIPKTFSFIYGTPFELYFSMQATAGTITDAGDGGYGNPLSTGSGSGYANFANTLVLNGLQTGDPFATYTSDSGTVYSAAGVAPEPSTMLLCAFALALVAFVKRQSAHKQVY